jgi:Leucine-rich repeat (LRR) protein
MTLDGIQKLVKMKKINLVQNKIAKMDYLDKLPIIKELSLGNNPISLIENISHLKDLEEINMGKTKIIDLKPLIMFEKVKKLTLNGMNLKAITNHFKSFDDLVKLDLSENLIEIMENLDELTELVELNLRQNKIRKIECL